MSATTAGGGAANEETRTASDDDVEEIQGRPRDGRQHVYVWRQREDHFIGHEELAETEEATRVERAAKRLVDEVKVSGPLVSKTVLMAGSVLLTVPIVILYGVAERALTEGLTAGADKG
jgi:hypothetical protein